MTSPWIAAFIALSVVVLVLAVLFIGLLRRVGDVLDRASSLVASSGHSGPQTGLVVGQRVGAFTARTGEGERISDIEVCGRRGAVVAFFGIGCAPCEEIMTELQRVGWSSPGGTRLVVVLDDDPAAKDRGLESSDVTVLYQEGGEVSAAFNVDVTPFVFAVVDDRTVVAAEVPVGLDAILNMAQVVAAERGGAVEGSFART